MVIIIKAIHPKLKQMQMFKDFKSSKKIKVCYLQQKYFFAHYSCTRNAIHNHLADRTQFRLMACNLTIIVYYQREVCNTHVHENELISACEVQKRECMFDQRQEGSVTLCSSILLACERMMRLKKSSSGTVGPRVEGRGGAHR